MKKKFSHLAFTSSFPRLQTTKEQAESRPLSYSPIYNKSFSWAWHSTSQGDEVSFEPMKTFWNTNRKCDLALPAGPWIYGEERPMGRCISPSLSVRISSWDGRKLETNSRVKPSQLLLLPKDNTCKISCISPSCKKSNLDKFIWYPCNAVEGISS